MPASAEELLATVLDANTVHARASERLAVEVSGLRADLTGMRADFRDMIESIGELNTHLQQVLEQDPKPPRRPPSSGVSRKLTRAALKLFEQPALRSALTALITSALLAGAAWFSGVRIQMPAASAVTSASGAGPEE